MLGWLGAGEAASETAREGVCDGAVRVEQRIEDRDLEADGSAAVQGEMEHGLELVPAESTRQPVVHGWHGVIVEGIAVEVYPEPVELRA
jgi:hypothetical protein